MGTLLSEKPKMFWTLEEINVDKTGLDLLLMLMDMYFSGAGFDRV